MSEPRTKAPLLRDSCEKARGPRCVDDPSGGACPPFTCRELGPRDLCDRHAFTCRELGLGFGAWTGWRAWNVVGERLTDAYDELERQRPGEWEHLSFARVVRLRCARKTRVRRPARSHAKNPPAVIPKSRRKIKA